MNGQIWMATGIGAGWGRMMELGEFCNDAAWTMSISRDIPRKCYEDLDSLDPARARAAAVSFHLVGVGQCKQE